LVVFDFSVVEGALHLGYRN